MSRIVNYARTADRGDGDGDGFEEVNDILAVPRYQRRDLVRNTVPPIDQKQVDNWLRFGYIDLNKQFVIGGEDHFRRMAAIIRQNRKAGPGHRYTGGDLLKVMLLQAIAQIGLPLKLGAEIIPAALRRAADKILSPDDARHGVIVVVPDGAGGYNVHSADRGEILDQIESEWFAVIDVDRIIYRFFATPRGRQTEAMPRDRKKD
jgi:hypothetical protein